MRLTCPNCGAQYEVPDEVIPESGRDVQCSNCGDTWFQHHPDHLPDHLPETDEPEDVWDTPHEASGEVTDPPYEDAQDGEGDVPPVDTPVDDGDQGSARRQRLDPAVADVLRQEAERERAARAADSSAGLETQPDLGLETASSDSDRRSAEAQARISRLRGEPDAAEPGDDEDGGPDPGTRRSLLPDIDEINSSLDADQQDTRRPEADNAYDAVAAKPRGGFRSGFRTVILLAVLGLVLYVLAPQIVQTAPALDGVMGAYVEAVNAARLWLDETVGRLIPGAPDGA